MRKVYVLLGTCKKTNQSWVAGVYTSLKKAEAAKFINYINNIGDLNKYEIINEVLI